MLLVRDSFYDMLVFQQEGTSALLELLSLRDHRVDMRFALGLAGRRPGLSGCTSRHARAWRAGIEDL